MTIDAQIEELRAELKGSLDRHEIAQIERELAAALAELTRHENAIEAPR